MAGSGIRIGDAERERTAASLREHYAKGRLTGEEFQQRLDATFTAKTDLDLDRVTEDLPLTDSYAAPWPPSASAGVGAGGGYRSGRGRQAWSATGAQSFARVGLSLVLLAGLLVLAFAWPLGGLPRIFLLLLAIFGFGRRILRRIFTGGRSMRRRWW